MSSCFQTAQWQMNAVAAVSCDSPCDSRNNPFWGEDAMFLSHRGGGGDTSASCDNSPADDASDDVKYIGKLELSQDDENLLVSDLIDIQVVDVNNFITLPEFQLFQSKDDAADLSDICPTFQLSGPLEQTTTQPPQAPLPPPPPPAGDEVGEQEETHQVGQTNVVMDCLQPRRRTRSARLRHVSNDDFVTDTSLYGRASDASVKATTAANRRRRNSSEHSIISSCSYDDLGSPYKRKRRRYEEDPSDDPAFEKSRKNAIIAKRNREKKKQLMEQMESRCGKLTAHNQHLECENSKLKHQVETLEEEVFYMKSILANQSALSQVLSNLKINDPLRLSTSFDVTKFNKKQQARQSGGPSQLKVSGGICLHVDGTQVSMEMCNKCAQMASGAARPGQLCPKSTKRN